jgi:hypothetical protein
MITGTAHRAQVGTILLLGGLFNMMFLHTLRAEVYLFSYG